MCRIVGRKCVCLCVCGWKKQAGLALAQLSFPWFATESPDEPARIHFEAPPAAGADRVGKALLQLCLPNQETGPRSESLDSESGTCKTCHLISGRACIAHAHFTLQIRCCCCCCWKLQASSLLLNFTCPSSAMQFPELLPPITTTPNKH